MLPSSATRVPGTRVPGTLAFIDCCRNDAVYTVFFPCFSDVNWLFKQVDLSMIGFSSEFGCNTRTNHTLPGSSCFLCADVSPDTGRCQTSRMMHR